MSQEVVNTYFWSRQPGKFVNKLTGDEVLTTSGVTKKIELVQVSEQAVNATPKTVVRVFQEQEVEVPAKAVGPQFYGTVREWYETLVETIIDGANVLHRRHLQAPTVLECPPDILTILEHTLAYRSNYLPDGQKAEVLPMTKGTFEGTLNKRFKVVQDNTAMPNEIKIVLVSDFRVTSIVDGAPTIEKFESPRRLDEFTIHVCDMCLI